MNKKIVNINSKPDCEMLIDRMHLTLAAEEPALVRRIPEAPSQFLRDDRHIFKGLSMAILSIQAVWSDIENNSAAIKGFLFDYDISEAANLSDVDITKLYETKFKPLNIKARFLKDELTWIRNDAIKFRNIQQNTGSVWEFIEQYIKAKGQDGLMKSFTKSDSPFKLDGVGLAICCEFFNNIGIDEFKPDTHATRFFNRIGVANSDSQRATRTIGITIAQTLGKLRKYVDSYVWNFCAEDRGEICTKNEPKCHLCLLNIEEPMLC